MPDTTTTNLALVVPEVGGSRNTWAAKLKTLFELLDTKAIYLAQHPTARMLGRVTAGTGAVEALTAAQVTAFLAAATTSGQGAMSAADKAKLDGQQWAWARLAADYALANSAAIQKMLDSTVSANGAVTLSVGLWEVLAAVQITGMSATSGNAVFSVPVGTAVVSHVWMQSTGLDNSSSGAAAAQSGQYGTGGSVNLAAAGTGTALSGGVRGLLRVTTAGTVIPSLTLDTANAATLKAGSSVLFRRIGDDTLTGGTWS